MNTKFRWYYKPAKVMIYPDDDEFCEMEMTLNSDGSYLARGRDMGTFYNDDIIGPMFWTGLKDKNGKDIYNLDFIKGHGEGIGKITWIECYFSMKLPRYRFPINETIEWFPQYAEIVGNEIENPELVELK